MVGNFCFSGMHTLHDEKVRTVDLGLASKSEEGLGPGGQGLEADIPGVLLVDKSHQFKNEVKIGATGLLCL